MPEQTRKRFHTAKSLTKAQYDAMCMRAALMARTLPTTSLPGQVVFTADHPGPPLAFSQLSSYGATYGGFGLVKTSRRTWQVLSRSSVPVPHSQTFSPEAQDQAAVYARGLGFPTVISSRTGTYRRSTHDADSFTTAFAAVAEMVGDPVLVHSTIPGELLRFLVRGQQVLAATRQGHRGNLNPEDLDPTLAELAIAAVDAIPGLDLAAVTISSPTSGPRLKDSNAGRQALVERVSRTPHLRDFAAGSGREALRLADRLVQSSAQDLGVTLPEKNTLTSAQLRFTGVPDPDSFTVLLGAVTKDLPATAALKGPDPVTDGAELIVRGPAAEAALLITRAIAGFGGGDSAQMVQSRPTESGATVAGLTSWQ